MQTIDREALALSTGGLGLDVATKLLAKHFTGVPTHLRVYSYLVEAATRLPQNAKVDWAGLRGHLASWSDLEKNQGYVAAKGHLNDVIDKYLGLTPK
jgi:hypothetical protein